MPSPDLLHTDPQERNAFDLPYFHSWVVAPTGQLIAAVQESVQREALIAAGAALDYVPARY